MNEKILYGGWETPPRRGILGLGLGGTFALLGAGCVTIGLLGTNLIAALITGLATAIGVLLATRRDRYGKSVFDKVGEKMRFKFKKASKHNLYRSGPTGKPVFSGKNRLPGLLARSELTEFTDPLGHPFSLISYRGKPSQSVIVFEAIPDGIALVDQSEINLFVARFGDWLNLLNQDASIIAAQITIETAPDFGLKLALEINNNQAPNPPAFAEATMQEIKNIFPDGGSELKVFIALTFNNIFDGKAKSINNLGEEIGLKIPELKRTLESCGAAFVRPLANQELCEFTRAAYDPAAAPLIAAAKAAGEDSGLTWENAGPVSYAADWDWFIHDSGFSRTWQMANAPRSAITETTIAKLLSPNPKIIKKRVTLLYRTISPAKAASLADADLDKTKATAGSSNFRGTITARNEKSLANARERAAAEAAGSGLVDFGMLVTATVTDEQLKSEIETIVRDLGAAAHLSLRPVYGAQAGGFAACLPLGIVSENLRTLSSLSSKGGPGND